MNTHILSALAGATIAATVVWQVQGVRLQAAHNDLQAFKAAVAAEASAAAARNVIVEREQRENLAKIRKDYESKISAVRHDALAAYRLHLATSGSSALSAASLGLKVDDGAVSQCLPDFIENAAECELKLGAWQEYGRVNKIPVDESAAENQAR